MSRITHTPGPWTSDFVKITAGGKEGGLVALVYAQGSGNLDGNSNLIAAAPDLFEALDALLATIERLDIREDVCCCGDDMEGHSDPMACGHGPVDAGEYYHGQTIEKAKNAIRKAQGLV